MCGREHCLADHPGPDRLADHFGTADHLADHLATELESYDTTVGLTDQLIGCPDLGCPDLGCSNSHSW
jgi:hypothetical protein